MGQGERFNRVVDSSFGSVLDSNAESERPSSLAGGLWAGTFAALIAALLWTGVTVLTGDRIGWLAITLGFVVGWAVRLGGRGNGPTFGAIGAALSLLSCFGGTVLSVYARVSRETGEAFVTLLTELEWGLVWELATSGLGPLDLVFVAIAAYQGYKFAEAPAV